MNNKNKYAFTIIELLVGMAIIALLVFLAVPRLVGYTKEAKWRQLTYDAKLLENACEMYYLANGNWPRASDAAYTAQDVMAFAAVVYDQKGTVVILDPQGSYYDLDMSKLSKYVTINEDPRNFILQNPVGSVYILDPTSNTRVKSGMAIPTQKPVAVITMTPDQGLLTTTVIAWSYANSYDPNGGSIVNAEWQGKQDVYPTEGQYTVQLRVQNDKGIWSDWTSVMFYVFDSKAVKQIAVGGGHTVALLNDGTVMTWGWNKYGQLGVGDTIDRVYPVAVPNLTGVVQVAAGNCHTVALLNDGTVKAWGYNIYGQVGDDSSTDRYVPVMVKHWKWGVGIIQLQGVKSISAGCDHNLALLEDGTVVAWGNNDFGQLGDGTTHMGWRMAFDIPNLNNVKQVSAGGRFSVALLNDGTIKVWGSNMWGELGNASLPSKTTTPSDQPNINNVVQIATGYLHTLALLDDGTVMGFGDSDCGQLGKGAAYQGQPPMRIAGLEGVVSVSAGFKHSVALLNDGTIKIWGSNCYGELGDGTTVLQNNIPTLVPGLAGVKHVATSASGAFTFVLLDNGVVKAWGRNSWGQLGDGTQTNHNTPVTITNLD